MSTTDDSLPSDDTTTEPVPDDPILLLCGAAHSCPVEVLNWYVDGLIRGVAAAPPGSIWPETRAAFPAMVGDRLRAMGVPRERAVLVTCAASLAVDLADGARGAYPPARDDSPLDVRD